ncbi:MAG: hypothetical protein JXR96_16685, partial [Deltaproteobacteria bacterium]|nr:hypothetical protein [Deltaproteobacteria bacterium]
AGACCDEPDCTDEDGDGYGVGADCEGPDCNDLDPDCHAGPCCDVPDCIDEDGDGYGEGADCEGPDCNDADPDCHVGDCCLPDCIDEDGDGYGEGADCEGPDCNDLDPDCHVGDCCEQPLLDCAHIFACVLGCGGDATCEDDCFARGDPLSRDLAALLITCQQAHDCQDESCLILYCEDELVACLHQPQCEDLDGDGYGVGPDCAGPDCDDSDPTCHAGNCCPSPTLDCGEVVACALACAGDLACVDGCLARADSDVTRMLAEEVLVCAEANDCHDEGCLLVHCQQPLLACLDQPECIDNDGDGFGEGEDCLGTDCDDTDPDCWAGACCRELSCPELLFCALECGGDEACVMDCFAQGDPQARQLALALYQCMLENDCQDEQCIMTYCQDELSDCMNQPSCTDNDGDGYGEGGDCLGPDCNDNDPNCWEGDCCLGTGLTCPEIMECGLGCGPDDVNCIMDCLNRGNPQARQLAMDLLMCAMENNCQDQDCLLAFCADELQACFAPPDCVDEDGDGYGEGADCLGPDCNDGDPACHAGSCCDPTASCVEIMYCVLGCDFSDMNCIQDCLAMGDGQSQQLAQSLLLCAIRNNCTDETCVLMYCPDEWAVCSADD